VPNHGSLRPYGHNPYRGYDSSPYPFLFAGDLPKGTPIEVTLQYDLKAEGWAVSAATAEGVSLEATLDRTPPTLSDLVEQLAGTTDGVPLARRAGSQVARNATPTSAAATPAA